MTTWVLFEGISCIDLKIDVKDWAEAQQIATIVPSGTLYKIDKGPVVLKKVPEKLQEEIVKGFIEAFTFKYSITRVITGHLYYSFQERKIICFLNIDTGKDGLSSVVYKNDGTGIYEFDRIILTHKYDVEYKGQNARVIYGLPKSIDLRPTIQTLSKLEVEE